MFSALGARVQVAVAVDLFAGTGALGIEALSRGAGFCIFVEKDPAVARVLEANLQRTGLRQRARIVREDVFSVLPNMGAGVLPQPAGLVLADPPYGTGMAARVLELLGRWPALLPGAAVVIEHGSREILPERAGQLVQERWYPHGDTAFTVYRVEPAS